MNNREAPSSPQLPRTVPATAADSAVTVHLVAIAAESDAPDILASAATHARCAGARLLNVRVRPLETVLMTYRGGGSESGRGRRIAAALGRLARGRDAVLWPSTVAVGADRCTANPQ